MENKINIAELLKDCPSGMELYSPIYGFGNLTKVTDRIHVKFPKEHNVKCFRLDGKVSENGEVMIFPKGKTTWEGFQRPFKDGDIVTTDSGEQVFILQRAKSNTEGYCYIGYDFGFNELYDASVWGFERFATEEEKERLFKAIKDNGYRWNAETKTLEKLIEPKFKVGDRVRHRRVEGSSIYRVVKIEESKYVVRKNIGECDYHIDFEVQDDWELVPNKFNINTLIPFESRVLIRDAEGEKWKPAIWGYYDANNTKYYPYETVGGNCFQFCIPYEKNEHLLGTKDDCDDYYKTWE